MASSGSRAGITAGRPAVAAAVTAARDFRKWRLRIRIGIFQWCTGRWSVELGSTLRRSAALNRLGLEFTNRKTAAALTTGITISKDILGAAAFKKN